MLSIESSVSYDTTLYHQSYRRSQSRKQQREVQDDNVLKSAFMEREAISDEYSSLKRMTFPRSPLSPQSFPTSKLSHVWSLTAAAVAAADIIPIQQTKQFAPIKELFVSPHPDDICYSCFSTVSQGNKTVIDGKRVIVTVFSKSRCANGELGQQLNRSIPDISRVRKIEDEQFAKMVGCKLYSLDQPDSSARDEYSRWTHLANQNVEEQHRVVKSHPQYLATVQALSPILRWAVECKATIYMPLGVGCHVDHLLTRVATTCILDDIKLERKSKLAIKLTYYEDLPYAFYATEESIQELARNVLSKEAKSSLIPVDQDCWDRKRQAVLTYATQVKPVILPALHERAITLASLEQNGDSSDPFTLKERIWTV